MTFGELEEVDEPIFEEVVGSWASATAEDVARRLHSRSLAC